MKPKIPIKTHIKPKLTSKIPMNTTKNKGINMQRLQNQKYNKNKRIRKYVPGECNCKNCVEKRIKHKTHCIEECTCEICTCPDCKALNQK